MAEPKTNELMEKIVSLCKSRGFIFQSSEVYGGINGFWDYGPLGAELKRNIKDFWWRKMTQWRDDIVGLDATIIMHPKIWEASGHTTTFSDPMVDCLLTKKRYRADQIDPQSGMAYYYSGATTGQQGPGSRDSSEPYAVLVPPGKPQESADKIARQFYEMRGVVAPVLILEKKEALQNSIKFNPENGSLLTEARQFNLMFKTYVGPVESPESVAYLRPETAQAIFVQFKNVLATSRQSVPFGICQIGKAFRNEINPRNFTFRSREFEQMELEFFIRPDEVVQKMAGSVATLADNPDLSTPQPNWGWEVWHKYWVEQRIKWYESIGLTRDSLEEYWQKKEELAHYARATVDILYKFPFGTQELEGIAARSNFDLTQHQKHSGKSMEYFDEEAKEKYIPHVIEPSAGVDRMVLALICKAYTEEQVTDDKGKTETRTVLKFHPRIAPIKVAVFPLLKNRPELVKKAREIYAMLKKEFAAVEFDDNGNIGKRYRRQDEIGTPFCIVVDFDTLTDDTVTVRDRDTGEQERIKVENLKKYIQAKI